MQGSTGLTDKTLVARCRAGDEEAWNELVARFSRYVYAICAQGFRFSPQDAEDTFQDVFAKISNETEKAFVVNAQITLIETRSPVLKDKSRLCEVLFVA